MKPHVVVVGGGFAGLSAVRRLAGAPVRITLIDKHNYHLFRPLTYQIATGLLSEDEVAAPLRSVFSRQSNAEVLMAEVTAIDTKSKSVRLDFGELHYDFLILATGIQYNYFGHEQWKELAPGLDSVADADKIRGKILSAFEAAERIATTSESKPDAIEQWLTFIIVGGGTAGVEMAGTIAELARFALARDFRHIDLHKARILLFEAGPRILPTFPEALSNKAHRHLERLGVTVQTSSRVEQVQPQGITVNDKQILSHTVLWCAGVLASPAADWLGAEKGRSGRVKVNPDLSVPGHPDVFVIGDTAEVIAESRNLFGIKAEKPGPMPGVAQPAIQEGKYVANVIRSRVAQRPAPGPFWYWNKGNLAVVGRGFAIADLGFLKSAGFAAWLLWSGVHIYFLIGFGKRILVFSRWAISFLTRRRAVRIYPLGQSEAERLNTSEPPVPKEHRRAA
ncbi:MAG: NAD(P)/FAD-dependent oxidoreductase [Bdellovibrionia bacterium]